MQSNPKSANQSALANASHLKTYDPSAPLRAMLMPPPPITTDMPTNNQYFSNPNLSQEGPSTNNEGVIKRIPQYYYPRYKDADGLSNVVDPRTQNPYLSSQPIELPTDPYASGQYYPYGTPYLIPLTTTVPQADPVPTVQEQSKADVIASHQKDADLSRLEVYHFTPKQNTSLSMGTVPTQPIVQYHLYPYPPGAGAPPLPQKQQQQQSQVPPYPYQPYTYPPYGAPNLTEPFQQVLPPIETKARSCQTEPPSTKNRGVSPIHFSSPAPIYDDDGYPYIHQRARHTDRYNITTGRINPRFYDHKFSSALADCRCLDCQRERAKVLNYYSN